MKFNGKAAPAKRMYKIPDLRKVLTTSMSAIVLLCGAGHPALATELSASKYGVLTFQDYSTYLHPRVYAHTAEIDVSDEMAQCLEPDQLYIAQAGGVIYITAWNTIMTGDDITSISQYLKGAIRNHCDHRIAGTITLKVAWTNGEKGSAPLDINVPAATSCSVQVTKDVNLRTSSAGISSVVQLTSGGSGGCNITVKPATADTMGGTLASSDGQGKTIHYHLTNGTWDATQKQWTLPQAQDSAVELLAPFSAGEYAGTATVTLVSE